jgi:hypothetical protein
MKKLFVAAIFCGASLAAGFALQTATAQPTPVRVRVPAPAPAPVRSVPIDAPALVAAIRKVLAENYVLPQRRGPLDAALAKGLADGRYNVADSSQLVQRINEDMEAVAHDKHLGLQYSPEQAAQLAGGRQRDDGPPSPQQVAGAQRRNHGVAELKLFPGNIRYLDFRGFIWVGAKSAEAFDNAMRFLRDGDAVIIDLRRNGGGSPEAVQYLISHFLEPNRPIVTFHMGATQVDRLSSLAELPAGRMVGKPLYVLTSGSTASAAEEFTGHIAGFRIGEVVGETTAGAGFRNEFFALPDGYVISVSVGRAVLAATGKDWEGVGIKPTIAIEEGKALDAARMHAMRRLAATATDPRAKSELDALSALLAAKLDPVTPALPLASYAGAFGERTIRVEEGKLIYQRAGGGRLTLVPVGPNVFTFEEDPLARVIFSVTGNQASGFELVRGDGSRVPVQRSN